MRAGGCAKDRGVKGRGEGKILSLPSGSYGAATRRVATRRRKQPGRYIVAFGDIDH